MIIGGCGGMAWTGEGGSIPGWRESYIQGIAIGEADFTQAEVVRYSASVRIKNTSGAWVTIGSVTSFQARAGEEGTSNTSITISDRSTWSPKGALHPGLLSPSNRTLQILCTMTSGGTSATAVVFTGNIMSFSEVVGRGGESINISCRALIERLADTALTYVAAMGKTRFLTLFEQAQVFGIPAPLLMFYDDGAATRDFYYFNFPILLRILFGWTARISAFQSGVIVQNRGAKQVNIATEIDDDSAMSETRSIATAAYNTVRTFAASGGYAEVSDAADVALRGKIYAPKLLYSGDMTLAELETQALYAIGEQVLGKITAQIRFNPLLFPGNTVGFTGTRMNVVGSGVIISISHTYSAGNASTSLELRVTPA